MKPSNGGGIGIMNGPANYSEQPTILEFFKFAGGAAVFVGCYVALCMI